MRQICLKNAVLAALAALALFGCSKEPTAHEAMTACYKQLDTQSPDWRTHSREPKMKVLVNRYMALCMRDAHFDQAARCQGGPLDERCYLRQKHVWDIL